MFRFFFWRGEKAGRQRKMAMVAAGAAMVGSFAAIVFCVKRFSQPALNLTGNLTGKVDKVESREQLQSIFQRGGKTVVYLSATW